MRVEVLEKVNEVFELVQDLELEEKEEIEEIVQNLKAKLENTFYQEFLMSLKEIIDDDDLTKDDAVSRLEEMVEEYEGVLGKDIIATLESSVDEIEEFDIENDYGVKQKLSELFEEFER